MYLCAHDYVKTNETTVSDRICDDVTSKKKKEKILCKQICVAKINAIQRNIEIWQ